MATSRLTPSRSDHTPTAPATTGVTDAYGHFSSIALSRSRFNRRPRPRAELASDPSVLAIPCASGSSTSYTSRGTLNYPVTNSRPTRGHRPSPPSEQVLSVPLCAEAVLALTAGAGRFARQSLRSSPVVRPSTPRSPAWLREAAKHSSTAGCRRAHGFERDDGVVRGSSRRCVEASRRKLRNGSPGHFERLLVKSS